MYIVGIHYSGWTSSAALLKEGSTASGLPRGAPRPKARIGKSRENCLAEEGIGFEDIDYMAVGFNPDINVAARFRGGLSERVPFPGHWMYAIPNQAFARLTPTDVSDTEQVFSVSDGSSFSVQYVTHHDCHAALAHYASPFDRSAILTLDVQRIESRDTGCLRIRPT